MVIQTLHVRIITPSQVLFEDDAISLSSVNSKGVFDILPEHANFITLVENHEIIIRVAKKPIVKFKYPLAIIYTFQNKVNIYTNLQDQPKLGH